MYVFSAVFFDVRNIILTSQRTQAIFAEMRGEAKSIVKYSKGI